MLFKRKQWIIKGPFNHQHEDLKSYKMEWIYFYYLYNLKFYSVLLIFFVKYFSLI
jgi:hypothetical protein